MQQGERWRNCGVGQNARGSMGMEEPDADEEPLGKI